MLPERWIVGSDLSPGSDAALRLGVAWARARGCELEVVHAVEESPASDDGERLQEALRDQVQRAGGDELEESPVVAVLEGPPREVLLRRAGNAGGIVVGAEGSSSTLLRQAGQVPAALATASEVPSLIVPLGWHGPGRSRRRAPAGSRVPRRRRDLAPAFARLMAACSLTARDRRRVAAMAALAGSGHRLMLAHSIDLSAHRHHPPSLRLAARARSLAAAREAEALLRDLAAEAPVDLAAASDMLIHVVRQGPPERDLAGLSASQSVGLLLVGTGPLAGRLVGLANTPLLVIP